MTSRAALPARRGLPRRTEARAKRTLVVARFLYPLAGVWGGFSPRTPAHPARVGVRGKALTSKPPSSNTGVTFLGMFHVEHWLGASCEEFVL